MATQKIDNILWTIVSLEGCLFAVRADEVHTMVLLPELSGLPNMPPHVRGVINLRGKVMPVIDLRKRLGMQSCGDEADALCAMLSQREQDHKNWLKELESSVQERREFKLATDPHRCAFGKWYDAFKTDKLLLTAALRKFDAPHQRIHAIAHKVLALEQAGNHPASQRLIDETREGTLAEMLRLFASLQATVHDSLREIAVVVEAKGQTFVVTVDSVETVGKLVEGSVDDLCGHGIDFRENGLVTAVGKLAKTNRLVLVLDTASLFTA